MSGTKKMRTISRTGSIRAVCTFVILTLIFLLCPAHRMTAFAADRIREESRTAENAAEDETEISEEDIAGLLEDLRAELDLEEIDDVLSENEATEDLSFSDLVAALISTDDEISKKDAIQRVLSLAFGYFADCRVAFIRIMLLVVAFAFFNNFIHVFENSQISTMGYYMFFLVLIALLMKSWMTVSDLFSGVMDLIIEMMQAIIPAFCMAMAFASATTTAAAFYQITTVVIWLAERLLCGVIVPMIHVYVILQMLNSLTGEKMISRFTALLKKIIQWSLRTLLAGVTGMNVIENMIAPSVDNLKKLSVTKTLGMIPGLGGITEAAGSIFFGSAVVIKNGVGTAAMIVLVCIALSPVIRLLVFDLIFRLTGAVAQPFSDSQVCGCIESAAEGAGLLLRALLTGILLFLITIAVVITAVR
ncbi:MAG: stage III sporulation protein AE [Clostridiales bacterium]|nr:stage III sporulation protein AE [Clostridiales bacterium]